MPLRNFICDPGISKCFLSTKGPCFNLSFKSKKMLLFYHNPKGSEGCGNCHLETWTSTGSDMPVTCEDTILFSPVSFLRQPIVSFLVLLILTAMKYTQHFSLSPSPQCSQRLHLSPRRFIVLGLLHQGKRYMYGGITRALASRCQNSPVNDCQLPTACTGRSQQVLAARLVCSPSSKIRILVIDFTELKQNFLFTTALSQPPSQRRK